MRAAKFLRLSAATLRSWAWVDGLPARSVDGGRLFFRRADLEAAFRQQRVGEWSALFSEVARALQERVASTTVTAS